VTKAKSGVLACPLKNLGVYFRLVYQGGHAPNLSVLSAQLQHTLSSLNKSGENRRARRSRGRKAGTSTTTTVSSGGSKLLQLDSIILQPKLPYNTRQFKRPKAR
jgi:hypothetical protein